MKAQRLLVGCFALAALVVAGCGGASVKGPSDTEMIQQVITDAMAGMMAEDIDVMLASYAEDFQSDNGDLEDTRAFLQGIKDAGFLQDIEVDLTGLVIDIDGDAATAGPVIILAAIGEIGLDFDLEKREGTWWVVGQSTDQ